MLRCRLCTAGRCRVSTRDEPRERDERREKRERREGRRRFGCGERMAEKCRDAEMVRGKKRRASGGESVVAGEPVWREDMDAMLEALVREGDLGMLSGALERIMMKQKCELDRQDVLEKSSCFGVQLQEVANQLARQQAAQHNSAVWPLTQDLTVKVSNDWLERIASIGVRVFAGCISFRLVVR